jgi:hypothetical protein
LSTNSTILTNNVVGQTSQTIFIADLISEGPIKGLVNGESSIYLNNVPIVEKSDSTIVPNSAATITFSGSTTNGLNVGILSEPIPITDLNLGFVAERFLYLYDYEEFSNVTVTHVNGQASFAISKSGVDFTTYNTYEDDTISARLVGPNKSIAGQIILNGSAVSFQAPNPITSAVSLSGNDYTLYIDKRFQIIARGTEDNIYLAAPPTIPAKAYKFFIGPLLLRAPTDETALEDVQKFGSTSVQFRKGNEWQPPIQEVGGVGSTPVIVGNLSQQTLIQCSSANAAALGLTLFSTSGYPEGESANGSPVTISAGSGGFNLSSSQILEVDELRILFDYGSLVTVSEEDGKKYTASAIYDISIQTFDGTQTSDWKQLFGGLVRHTDKRTSPISFEHTIDLAPFRPFTNFNIRITRLSRAIGVAVRETGVNYPDQDKSNSTASISSITSVIKEKFIYPYTAYAGITFSSETFSSVPTRTYECYGLEIRIPTTYTTREESSTGEAIYADFWNGTFKDVPEYTDNPAWVYYDILTNNRYGAGQWLEEFQINKYALYRIARYCDEIVSDGKGGFEPRFRANVYLTKAADVYKVLKDMATIFTGMLYYLEGQITPIIDAPADPVYTFSKGNIIDGAFSYESTGTKTRPNQITVTWNNPEFNYEQQALIVEDTNDIVRKGRIINESAFAFGTTSEGQATRYGRWKLYTAQFQTEIVNFSTALQGGFLQPGDIINIQDADRYGVSLSGRLRSGATTTSIPIDRVVTLLAGFTYELTILVSEPAAYCAQDTATIDGNTYTKGEKIAGITTEEAASSVYDDDDNLVAVTWKSYTHTETRTVSSYNSSTKTLIVSSPFSIAPGGNTIWAMKELSTDTGTPTVNSTRMYRILTIGESSKNIYSISAVEHYNEKYDAVDKDYSLAEIPDLIFGKESTIVPAPVNLYLLTLSDFKRPKEEIELVWEAPDDFDFVAGYEIVHNIPTINSPLNVGKNTLTYRFDRVDNGFFTFRVRTVSADGNYSPYTSVSAIVDDPFRDNVPRSAGGLAQGALCNVSGFIDASNFYRFEEETYALAPVQSAFNPYVNNSSDPTSYSQDISGISDTVVDTSSPVATFISSYFVYFDRNNADKLKLIGWDIFTFNNLYYWYDAGNGSQNPTFYSLTGTATIEQGSNKVTGTGTSFSTELNIGDVIKVATGVAAKVSAIQSDTVLILDRSFTQAYTNITIQTTTLQIDFKTDCIIARVYYDGANYFYENYLTLDPNLDLLAKYVNVDSNIQFINYSAAEVQETTYDNITLNITASGFTTPEFKVTGTGFSGVTGAADADYVSATSPNTYTRLINSNADVAYSGGSALEFIVDVREGNDPTNVNKQRSTTFRIGKVIGGSEGQNARAVSLTATDYSVVYDQNGANPSYEGTSPNIILTATAQGFSNPVYKFTGDGIVDQTVYDVTNTVNFPVPSSYFSSPQVLRVSVAENGINTEEAFDNISITGVKPGAEGYTVILTNEAHTLPADTSGVVTSFAGSGSLIEVFKGGTQLQYITSGTPTLGEFSVLVSSNTGMSAPVITVSGLNASIADFTDMTDDTETVTYTINVENISTTIQKKQSFSKSKEGAIGDTGDTGDTGDSGAYSGIIVLRDDTGVPTSTRLLSINIINSQVLAGTYALCYATAAAGSQPTDVRAYRANQNNPAGLIGTTGWTLVTDFINTEVIAANAITANQLQISATGAGASRMFFNGDDNRIEIYDSAGTVRVVLGNLTGI